MRSDKIEKLNMRTFGSALICMLIILVFASAGTGIYAAGGDELTVKIPYTHKYDADANRTGDSFTYRVTPVGGAPMPEGSRDGAYYFTVKGTPGGEAVDGKLSLKIAFTAPGEYKYKIAAYAPDKEEGFRYESRTYTVSVYVENKAGGGLKASMVTALGSDGYKYGSLSLNPGHDSEVLPPEKVRPTTTPSGDGTVPEEGVSTGGNTNRGNGGNDGNAGNGGNTQTNAGTPINTDNAAPADNPEDNEETIEDNRTPLQRLADNLVPKAAPDKDNWSLLNLILTILSIAMAAAMAKRYFERIDTDEDEYIIRRGGMLRLLGIIPAAAETLLFISTEKIPGNRMTFTDEWTALTCVIMAGAMIIAFAAYRRYNEKVQTI